MVRWAWKRWVCAGLLGVAVAGSAAFAQTPPPAGAGSVAAAKDGLRPNETITLRFPGQPDRKVTVLKVTMMANGSLESEVRDPLTWKTYTLIEPGRPQAIAPPPMFTAVKPTVQAPTLQVPVEEETIPA